MIKSFCQWWVSTVLNDDLSTDIWTAPNVLLCACFSPRPGVFSYRGRCLISDPLSLKHHSSESNRPTPFLLDFYERSNIFSAKIYFRSVQVTTHLVVITNSATPCKNGNREVVPYLRPSPVGSMESPCIISWNKKRWRKIIVIWAFRT